MKSSDMIDGKTVKISYAAEDSKSYIYLNNDYYEKHMALLKEEGFETYCKNDTLEDGRFMVIYHRKPFVKVEVNVPNIPQWNNLGELCINYDSVIFNKNKDDFIVTIAVFLIEHYRLKIACFNLDLDAMLEFTSIIGVTVVETVAILDTVLDMLRF